MAFDIRNLFEVRALGNNKWHWNYRTSDTLAQVLAADYFSTVNGLSRIHAGDVLDIVASSDAESQQVSVSSVAGGSVVLVQSAAGAVSSSALATGLGAAAPMAAVADAAWPVSLSEFSSPVSMTTRQRIRQRPTLKDISSTVLGSGQEATAAFQKGYDTGEPVILIPTGDYNTDQVTIKPKVVFRGMAGPQDWAASKGLLVRAKAGMSGYMFSTPDAVCDAWGFHDIYFDASSEIASTTLLGLIQARHAHGVQIHGCVAFPFPGNIISTAMAGSIVTNVCQDWFLVNNRLTGCCVASPSVRVATLLLSGPDHWMTLNEINANRFAALSGSEATGSAVVACWVVTGTTVRSSINVYEGGGFCGLLLDGANYFQSSSDRIEFCAGHGLVMTGGQQHATLMNPRFLSNGFGIDNTYCDIYHHSTNGSDYAIWNEFQNAWFGRNGAYASKVKYHIEDNRPGANAVNRYDGSRMTASFGTAATNVANAASVARLTELL